jgi:hypothetical protein
MSLISALVSQCVPASVSVALCCPHVACAALLLLCPRTAASMYFPVTLVSRDELTGLFSCLHAPSLWPQTRSPAVAGMERRSAPRRSSVARMSSVDKADERTKTAHVHDLRQAALFLFSRSAAVQILMQFKLLMLAPGPGARRSSLHSTTSQATGGHQRRASIQRLVSMDTGVNGEGGWRSQSVATGVGRSVMLMSKRSVPPCGGWLGSTPSHEPRCWERS